MPPFLSGLSELLFISASDFMLKFSQMPRNSWLFLPVSEGVETLLRSAVCLEELPLTVTRCAVTWAPVPGPFFLFSFFKIGIYLLLSKGRESAGSFLGAQ